MLFVVILTLFVLSFALAVLSLRKEIKKPKELDHFKRELMKEKVLFIKD